MTTAYFDCYNGISGDMTLGALVDLGVPIEELRAALASLPVQGYTINSQRVKRCGIGATQVRIEVTEKQPHRHFSHIRDIIEKSGFESRVKERAIAAFHKIAAAEAAIHEVSVERIHFHEVGGVDAIVDIIGAMWGLDQLGIESCQGSIVAVGSGTIRAAHGEMPVPAPATARLLENVPVCTGPIGGELTTPTGAAILTTVCNSFGPLTDFQMHKTGYGAGSREYEGHTNYLRVLIGKSSSAAVTSNLPVERRELVVLQTEIDDMSPEQLGHVMNLLFAGGCLDAHFAPVFMKKNRPATSVQVLAAPDDANKFIELLLRETSTFGVKLIPCQRFCLARRFEEVSTPFGRVRIKIGMWGDSALKASPEYEDCRTLAEEKRVPIAEVFLAAQHAWKALDTSSH